MGYVNGKWVNPPSKRARTPMEVLIKQNLWKTKHIAESFHLMTGLPKEELEGVARVSLMKCAETYREDAPANFSTWVNRCLRLHLLNFLRDKSRIIKIPRKYTQIYLKVRKEFKKNPDVSFKKISKTLDIPLGEILAAYTCFKIKILDISRFKEVIIESNVEQELYDSIFNSIFNLKDEEEEDNELGEKESFFGKSDYSIVSAKEIDEEDKVLFNDVMNRGLCDRTLSRNYKIDPALLTDKVQELMERVYFLS